MSRFTLFPSLLFLILFVFVSFSLFPLTSSQAILTFSEMSAIQCNPTTINNATCVQCPNPDNITLPSDFFLSSVPCTRVPHFSDTSLAYMSQPDSVSLSFYYVEETGTPSCSPSNLIYSVVVPNSNKCGTAPALSYSVVLYSQFNALDNETITWAVNSNPVQCGNWVSNASSCPLEHSAKTLCPSTAPGYAGFFSAIGFSMTMYNFCPSSCDQDYSSLCSTNRQKCETTAQAIATSNPTLENQLLCGCYQSQYACAAASGCYAGSNALTQLMNSVTNYCGSNSAFTFACPNATTTTTTTVTSPAVTMTCSSSDFGGSFGGAIFGTFIMHMLTVLAFYARRKMGAQTVTVSKQTVGAEEVAMVTK